jgi:hypothetical protein
LEFGGTAFSFLILEKGVSVNLAPFWLLFIFLAAFFILLVLHFEVSQWIAYNNHLITKHA